MAASLEYLADHIDQLSRGPERHSQLRAFLNERADYYKAMGAADVDRLRAYAMAAIANTESVGDIEGVILEELETGYNPYIVAAAALALRHLPSPPKETIDLLMDTLTRLRTSDNKVWFDTISRAPRPDIEITLLTVLFETLGHFAPLEEAALERLQDWSQAYSHLLSPIPLEALAGLLAQPSSAPACCSRKGTPSAIDRHIDCPDIAPDMWDIMIEDHRGQNQSFGNLRDSRPTVLAFFYTRCLNPEKCSLTISNLGQLHRLADATGLGDKVNIFGMSYDPDWDTPHRLRVYGEDRNFPFSRTTRLIRSRERWAELVSAFDLRVGYGPATVNRHQIDLFVINRQGQVSERYVQRKWSVETVFASLKALIPSKSQYDKRPVETV